MNVEQILNRWRDHIAEKLQDRFGLQEEEARRRATRWLHSIEPPPIPTTQSGQGWALHYRIRSARARSAAATRF